MSIYINEFMDGANSICREERQFSLYLYNLLADCRKIKIDYEGFANKNYEVVQAYYEASFMRDYFNAADDKSEFNRKLVNFANRKLKMLYADSQCEVVTADEFKAAALPVDSIYDINKDINAEDISFDVAKHINGWSGKDEREYRNPVAKWMMNVKPDIALLLKRKGVKRDDYRLHFIECKYTSGMDVYPSWIGVSGEDGSIKECKKLVFTQTELLELVLEFLCDELELAFDGENNSVVSGTFVSAAYFLGSYSERHITEDGEELNDKNSISLQKLCEYNSTDDGKKTREPKVLLGRTVEVTF